MILGPGMQTVTWATSKYDKTSVIVQGNKRTGCPQRHKRSSHTAPATFTACPPAYPSKTNLQSWLAFFLRTIKEWNKLPQTKYAMATRTPEIFSLGSSETQCSANAKTCKLFISFINQMPTYHVHPAKIINLMIVGSIRPTRTTPPPHPLLWAISIINACPLHIEISKSGRIGWVHVKIILYLIYFISWLGLYCTVDKIEIFKIFRFVRIYLICHFHTRFFYRGWLKIIYITWMMELPTTK